MRVVRLAAALAVAATSIASSQPAARAQVSSTAGEPVRAVSSSVESTAQIMAREDDRSTLSRRAAGHLTLGTGTSFTAIQFSETSTFPPDGSAAAGPTQFIAIANGRIRSFLKSGVADGVLNAKTSTFFDTVRGSGTPFGGRIRFDRLSSRWFITMATDAVPGRTVIASSSGATITAATVWSFSAFDDTFLGTDCTTDAPSLGVDAHALYLGANQYCTAGTTFRGSSAWVVRKASVLDGAVAIVTAFHDLTGGASGAGPFAPQGVNNDDPAAATGYFLAVDNTALGTLVLRRIATPGGTPTISGNINIAVAATALPVPIRHRGNTAGANGYLSANDDRLASVYLRGGSAWAAHTIAVNESGSAAGTTTRDGVRWYEIGSLDSTPAVLQSGTLHDSSTPGSVDARNYFNASIATSRLGRTVIGFSSAGTNEYVNAGAADRAAGDPAGTLTAPAIATSSAAAYNPAADPGSPTGRRWGGYSETVMDGCDGTTLWSLQQFTDATDSYGLRAIKVQGVAPPVPVSASPASVQSNLPSVDVVVTASPGTAGAAFFDSPAGFACAISASISGVTVNSVTRNSATQVTLNLSTVNAVGGVKAITIANPDGQSATGAGLLNVLAGPAMAIETPAAGATVGQPVLVRGWAIDTAAPSGSGIDAVHVYATPSGGGPIFIGAADYGTSRPDVAQLYGAQFGAAGFSLRANQVLPPGAYTLTVYGHSTATNAFSNVQSVAVVLKAPVAPFGAIDTPIDNSTAAGEMGVTGWVVDEAGVRDVRIYRSPTPSEGSALVFIGQAVFSRGARPDVQAAYPAYPDSDAAGWGYMVLTNMLPNQGNGDVILHAYATNHAGQTTLLGSRRVTLSNATSTRPFGSIDTPGQGETVSGVIVNFGWALATAGRTIPIDGSTIDVYVDNVLVGHPTYNNFRADIAAVFPGLANSNGAVGYFMLDTRTLSNGVHTIAWIIRDDAGQASGVGSRYFRVQNGS
jgi:hypothetical protein